jgi:L-iditol 2-dehydrogenase
VRVAVYYRNDHIRIEERPRPRAGPGELLVRVEASGICGSDVMEWYRVPKAPVVLGHEIAGEIVEAGPGVRGFREGDRVVATHHVPCMVCRYCLTERHSSCETLHRTRFDPGGFAEFVRLPAENVERGTFPLPPHVSFAEGSFVEPLACVVRGQRLAGVRAGRSVLVLGSGISGILHIQLARAVGAGPIVATDVNDWRVGAALRFGADAAIHGSKLSAERLRELMDGRLADTVIVSTAAPAAFEQALECVDRGGTILRFAPSPPGTKFALDLHDSYWRGIAVVHSYAGPPADMRTALDLIASGRINVASTITHRLPLEDTAKGFALVASAGESLKVLVEPQR